MYTLETNKKNSVSHIGIGLGEKNGNSRLTNNEICDILEMFKNGEQLKDIHAKHNHVTKQAVWYVIHKSKMR